MSPDRYAHLFSLIRAIPDFPAPGILFRDITPLVADPHAFGEIVELLAERIGPYHATALAAIEARGFVFGAALASRLQLSLQLIRKPGKLPWRTASAEYQLEYGTDRLEIHRDAADVSTRAVVVDDLLATGGTAAAAVALLRSLGAQVCCVAAPLELKGLRGRERLDGVPVESLLVFP